ncbi:unnamed protein product [Vitrella brassicaformis CCMP3155]|uniref:Uncharacterized protein n=1 Tax=Vitrella brassicaformis (strain CCMP3155) TaxID=1169540 RepID=A0A0G4G9D8_VITBC|nr:unnamed protein product [Vitrella brassicaformis CCMP3155]|eukprot:CEM25408.1 unnamed protein product [Vitrella brassicaformis CCMP3155]
MEAGECDAGGNGGGGSSATHLPGSVTDAANQQAASYSDVLHRMREQLELMRDITSTLHTQCVDLSATREDVSGRLAERLMRIESDIAHMKQMIESSQVRVGEAVVCQRTLSKERAKASNSCRRSGVGPRCVGVLTAEPLCERTMSCPFLATKKASVPPREIGKGPEDTTGATHRNMPIAPRSLDQGASHSRGRSSSLPPRVVSPSLHDDASPSGQRSSGGQVRIEDIEVLHQLLVQNHAIACMDASQLPNQSPMTLQDHASVRRALQAAKDALWMGFGSLQNIRYQHDPQLEGNLFHLHKRGSMSTRNDGPAQLLLTPLDHANISSFFSPRDLGHRLLSKGAFSLSYGCCDRFAVDYAKSATRAMWERMPTDVARNMGRGLVNLKTLVVRYPVDAPSWCCEVTYNPLWCSHVWVSIVEGHVEGREAMKKEKRQREASSRGAPTATTNQQASFHGKADKGSLHTIVFEAVPLSECDRATSVSNEYSRLTIRLLNEYSWPPPASSSSSRTPRRRSLPPPTPITLPALTTITGLRPGQANIISDRRWRTPALERAQGSTTQLPPNPRPWDRASLSFIGTSKRLKHIDMETKMGVMVEVLSRVSPPADGQPGGLAALETIATLELEIGLSKSEAAVDKLRGLLVRHKCRSIRSILILINIEKNAVDSRELFAFLSAVDRLQEALGTHTDISILTPYLRDRGLRVGFHLPAIVPATSYRLFTFTFNMIAGQAATVEWRVDASRQEELRSPPQAETDLFHTLRFPSAKKVDVSVDNLGALASRPLPTLSALAALPADAFPAASKLAIVDGRLCEPGGVLAQKMPKIASVTVGPSNSSGAVMAADLLGLLRRAGGGKTLRVDIGGVLGGLGGAGVRWDED